MTEQNELNKLRLLVLKGLFVGKIATEEGLFQLYGHDGQYVEAFVSHNVSYPATFKLVISLDRLAEYVDEELNSWRWREE
jgi:hypothetical protein